MKGPLDLPLKGEDCADCQFKAGRPLMRQVVRDCAIEAECAARGWTILRFVSWEVAASVEALLESAAIGPVPDRVAEDVALADSGFKPPDSFFDIRRSVMAAIGGPGVA